jgi:hypothetical protein
MPLLSGKKNIGKNIKELHSGKVYAKTAQKFGKAVANKQAIAIAMEKSRNKKK